MSKRTLIIAGIVIAAFIAAIASLYFEHRKEVSELEGIINGDPDPVTTRRIYKKKEPVSVVPEVVDNNPDKFNDNESE